MKLTTKTHQVVLLSETEWSEKDLVLPKRNSGSGTREAELGKQNSENEITQKTKLEQDLNHVTVADLFSVQAL
ncbi:predicted protein [Methanosarcina acetivorans C2A]|uniref:Uncharacterized protein n=1 Tax=Methanosarcina acetivorans (strain ATCC 35395 / DSM 2834 / JCM 12185 / C2A) TaxID=188937 RepID=Q8TPN5_METAC|nr:predicted protein [Methanosarcina acetivorans C2A]